MKKEYKKIIDEIQSWAKDRGFDKIEFSSDSLNGNTAEELCEFYAAMSSWYRTEDERYIYDMADALCDRAVYMIADSVKLNTIVDTKDMVEALDSSFGQIDELNLNPIICFEEVIKEISSRSGEWSDELQKWKKDDIQKHLYSARFSRAKL